MKKVTFKLIEQNLASEQFYNNHKIVRLAKDDKSLVFAIIDTRLQVVDEIVEYRTDLDSFTKVQGFFNTVSETTFYWLRRLIKREDK